MKIIMLFYLAMVSAFAIDLNYFNDQKEIVLLKDQRVFITITDRDEKRLLMFRWTLFHNNGLVTISHNNGHPKQNILYTRYNEDSLKFRIALRDEEKSLYHPYVIITFLGYDYVTKKAKFLILHKDSGSQTDIDIKIEP